GSSSPSSAKGGVRGSAVCSAGSVTWSSVDAARSAAAGSSGRGRGLVSTGLLTDWRVKTPARLPPELGFFAIANVGARPVGRGRLRLLARGWGSLFGWPPSAPAGGGLISPVVA